MRRFLGYGWTNVELTRDDDILTVLMTLNDGEVFQNTLELPMANWTSGYDRSPVEVEGYGNGELKITRENEQPLTTSLYHDHEGEGEDSIEIGHDALASEKETIAFGYQTKAQHALSVAIGPSASTDDENQIKIGTSDHRSVFDGDVRARSNFSLAGELTVESAVYLEHDFEIKGDSNLKGSLEVTNSAKFSSNVTVQGDLTVNGTRFETNVEEVKISDNTIVINEGETGDGVSAGYAGVTVDRGNLDNYNFIYEEDRDGFVIGREGDEQVVATREDNPNNRSIAIWREDENRYCTDERLVWDDGDLLLDDQKVATENYADSVSSTALDDAKTHSDSELADHNESKGDVHGVPDGEEVEWKSASQSKADTAESNAKSYSDDAVSTHNEKKGNVHGVPSDEQVEWQSSAQSKADTAESNAKSYTDSEIEALPRDDWTSAYQRSPVSISGSGNGTLTLEREDQDDLTTDLSHTHDFDDLPISSSDVSNWDTAYNKHPTSIDADSESGELSITLTLNDDSTLTTTTTLKLDTDDVYVSRSGDSMTGNLDMQSNEIQMGDYTIVYANDRLEFKGSNGLIAFIDEDGVHAKQFIEDID